MHILYIDVVIVLLIHFFLTVVSPASALQNMVKHFIFIPLVNSKECHFLPNMLLKLIVSSNFPQVSDQRKRRRKQKKKLHRLCFEVLLGLKTERIVIFTATLLICFNRKNKRKKKRLQR